jgi:hypothetical protein
MMAQKKKGAVVESSAPLESAFFASQTNNPFSDDCLTNYIRKPGYNIAQSF